VAITLYYAPGTRATRVAFLLEELEVAYERHTLDTAASEHKQPAYLRIHPHGLVPALRDGDTVVFETAAICLYLADRFPEKGLAPAVGSPERAAYYQWAVYSVATLEPILADIWLQLQRPEGERDSGLMQSAGARFRESAAVLTSALRSSYLIGERFSAADVLIGSMLSWAAAMGLLEGQKLLSEYVDRISKRPAFGRS
jgi:glutathione S-transferase